jgi:carbon-monoxide dehydrogenase large subunit
MLTPGLRVKTIANLGGYVDVLIVGADPFYGALSAIRDPGDLCEVDAVTPTPCRSTPIAAGRPGRPSWSSGWSRSAREMAVDPVELRRKNFVKNSHQTPVIMTYDAGDYGSSIRRSNSPTSSGRATRAGQQLRGIGYSTISGLSRPRRRSALGGGVAMGSAEVRVSDGLSPGSHAHGQVTDHLRAVVCERPAFPSRT